MMCARERNDSGRVCRYGTVKVTELAILETYPTVFHLTSTVVGQLREGKNIIDLLKATFPGGAIVYDSEPEAEYIETLDKGKALIQALGLAVGKDAEIIS